MWDTSSQDELARVSVPLSYQFDDDWGVLPNLDDIWGLFPSTESWDVLPLLSGVGVDKTDLLNGTCATLSSSEVGIESAVADSCLGASAATSKWRSSIRRRVLARDRN